jgi:Fe-S-cluster-containing hydrogenase component 2
MKTKVMRKIINIDEAKCDGCGSCIDSCAEGALALVDGKARLVKEIYCDGLAACLKECPQGALSIVERESEDFDEEATREHLQQIEKVKSTACSCPGSAVRQLEKKADSDYVNNPVRQESELTNWPVQLTLVPPNAPFIKNSDVVLIADCVPVAYPNLHSDFVKGHTVLVACPKLDDFEAHLAKLTSILEHTRIKSLTVVHMEVPCCAGLTYMARKAIAASGQDIPLKEVTIGVKGSILAEAIAPV